ncbi:MAG: XRE family transcriptional regulator [Thermodesulfobacteriota bacterium]
MPRKKKSEPTPIGERLRKVRDEKGMDLAQLANETGVAVGLLEKIEKGEVMPPVGTLLSLARALETDSEALLTEDAGSKKERERAYSRRTAHYAYTTLSPGARHKHLKAFKVAIEPRSDHSGVGYCHEGEEFAFVLSGQVEITVGENKNLLSAGESLHFNSGINHNLRNPGDKPAELIVVVYTP